MSYAEQRPHGIMFHHFHGQGHPPGQGSISQEQFADMLDFLGRDRILSAEEWIDRSAKSSLRAGDLCITFDDNLRCQYDIAVPVLRAKGIRPFWFIYTSVLDGAVEPLEVYRYFRSTAFAEIDDFYAAFFTAVEKSMHASTVERALRGFIPADYLKDFPFYSDNDRKFRFVRDQVLKTAGYNQVMDQMIAAAGLRPAAIADRLWMKREHIRELDGAGHAVGLHSHSHPTTLDQLSAAEQRKEYETNFSYLQALLGKKPLSASHPCNSYSAATLEIMRDLGIRVAFRANMVQLSGSSPLEIPREDHALVLKKMGER